MINIAKHIDQVKGDHECKNKVREYASILDNWTGPELTVFGNLILDGTLRENNKQRLVLLFETMLIITKEKEDRRLQFKHSIWVNNIRIVATTTKLEFTEYECSIFCLIYLLQARNLSLDDRGEPTTFTVIHFDRYPRMEIKLTALNRSEKRKWTHYIKKVMLASCNVKERIRDELMKLGDENYSTAGRTNWASAVKPAYIPNISKNQRKSSADVAEQVSVAPTSQINDYKKIEALDSMIKELQKRTSAADQTNGFTELTNSANSAPTVTISNDYETPFDANKALPKEPTALPKLKSKLFDVGLYNGRAMAKSASKAKRERSKTLKVTSKFYMELPDFSSTDTVLKITESTDDIGMIEKRLDRRRASLDATDAIVKALDEKHERKISLESALHSKRESDIISELLKNHRDFDRILNKPLKSKLEPDRSAPAIQTPTKYPTKFVRNDSILHSPLPPPPIEVNDASTSDIFVQRELPPEPIYESLLRNVHVPYRFPSPILHRSASHSSTRLTQIKRPLVAPPKRPDSSGATMTHSQSFEQNANEDDYIEMPRNGN